MFYSNLVVNILIVTSFLWWLEKPGAIFPYCLQCTPIHGVDSKFL